MVNFRKGLAVIVATWALAGCASMRPPPPIEGPGPSVIVEEEPEWRGIVSDGDAGRLEALASAWDRGLAEARRRGHARSVAEEGDLLDPAAALPRAEPPPGPYRCRIVRLGGGGRGPVFRDYPPFFCHVQVEGDRLSLTKQTGSQRLGGWLFPDERPDRMIFLGSLMLGEEETPPPYSESGERDMAGVVERIGFFRYRLVVPWPRHGGAIDIYELVPAIA